MELEITEFFNSCAPRDFSASVAEIGADAGPSTWRAAVEESTNSLILDTEEKREAFRDFVRGAGAWSDDEINAWSDIELNALCIQWISGDMREPVGFELSAHTSSEGWAEYEKQSSAGDVSGRLFKGIDGKIYFDIGS